MRVRQLLLMIIIVGAPTAALAAPVVPCDLAHVRSARELHELLSERSVEIIALAKRADRTSTDRLAQLVASNAQFSLGASDVGRPLGSGPAGARALATLMNAETYGFSGWNYMDEPADGCSLRKVTIAFMNGVTEHRSEIEFSYENGRLVRAEGWEWTYKSGPLDKVR